MNSESIQLQEERSLLIHNFKSCTLCILFQLAFMCEKKNFLKVLAEKNLCISLTLTSSFSLFNFLFFQHFGSLIAVHVL